MLAELLVKTFDTNIVVRLLIKDDETQSRLAGLAWRNTLAEGNVFLTKVVIVEVSWVLRTAYRFTRPMIAEALRKLLAIKGVVFENREQVRRALEQFEGGSADFSDYLILETAKDADALPVLTFDQRFARAENVHIVNR